MNFSIIFPTRQRIKLLTDLCLSIHETTFDKKNIEVLPGYDLDDKQTEETLKSLSSTYEWLKPFGRNRSDNMSRDYFNWLFKKSIGRFILVINDDCLFRTYNWDQIAKLRLMDYLRDKPDGVVYGWISDSLTRREENTNYTCFPLLSRQAINAVGYVLRPDFRGWNADIHLCRLYESVGRTLNLSEIWVDHISYHTGKNTRDETSYNMEKISGCSPRIDNIEDDKNKLLNYIKRFPRISK